MLAHPKTKRRTSGASSSTCFQGYDDTNPNNLQSHIAILSTMEDDTSNYNYNYNAGGEYDNGDTSEQDATQLTCDVLCSLGAVASCGPSYSSNHSIASNCASDSAMDHHGSMGCPKGGKSAALACPKQHQLPMFLSKTYHMIDRCEPSIATWSMDGSNFVVKNVEKFAGNVLPLYFKHSNFSSFARQLNFYGFRKLRTDPILTSDVDPRTACYVRFYHEKFQKDRPDLLHQIKRATKSDQQSKDDVDSLKAEVAKLRETVGQLRDDTDRRLAEMSYECNRRITSMGADYDKLAAVVQQLLATNPAAAAAAAAAPPPPPHVAQSQPVAVAPHPPSLVGLPPGVQNALRHNPHAAAIAAAAAVAAGVQPVPSSMLHPPSSAAPPMAAATPAPATTAASPPPPAEAPPPLPDAADAADVASSRMPDLMQSLSQAAVISLQQQATAFAAAAAANTANGDNNTNSSSYNKRPAEEEAFGAPPGTIARH